ncbi:MAG: ATP-binding protein [Pseudomonadota bacterium]
MKILTDIRARRSRKVLFAALAMLLIVFALMAFNLLRGLDRLSSAEKDNAQWRIAQLDTEFANLNAVLSEASATDVPDSEFIRLRLDIALSRLDVVTSGGSRALFNGTPEAEVWLSQIASFAARAVELSDAKDVFQPQDVSELRRLVSDIRPVVRDVALLGVAIGAQQSQDGRDVFARQLRLTGGVAIGLLGLMAALLVVLDKMMRRARERDAALRVSADQLSSTLEASLDAIVAADEQGRIIEFNGAAEDIFGWHHDDIVGRKLEQTIVPHHMRSADASGLAGYLEALSDAGRVELAAMRKDGEEFPVELSVKTVPSAHGLRFVAYIRDISLRKINEQKLIDAKDRAVSMDRAKSQFLAVMSHEMRTPLNGVLGVLDLLLQSKLSNKQERYARIAMASSEILLEHTNEALDITRIETGELELMAADFDLRQLVNSLIDVLSPLAQEKGLKLTCEFGPHTERSFNGDSNRLRQILTNLVGNAIKFTETGGVTMKVSGRHGPEHTTLAFAVSDTGAGIAPEFQSKVFEDFFSLGLDDTGPSRADVPGRQLRGDGMGLSISRRIAQQLGGDIGLDSRVGEGSTFTLTVPFERAQDASVVSRVAPHSDAVPHLSRRVLVVEDNDINRSILCDILTGLGHSAVEAKNGADCLERAAQEDFDAIFMDISMPVMDGITATHHLRRAAGQRNAQTAIFGLTAHGREEYRERALAAGMTQLYAKPIRIEMVQSILALLSGQGAQPTHAAGDDGTVLDLLDVLGVEKTEMALKKYFLELDAFVDTVRKTDNGDLEQEAHRLRGTAALMGLQTIEDAIWIYEDAAQTARALDTTQFADRLTALAQQAQAEVARALEARAQ